MSSFRQYGGLDRAPTNNIVRNHYSNSDNPTISNHLGQWNSKIVSESHLDLSGNSILNVHGIYFDNSFSIIDGSLNGDITINGNLEVTKNTKLDGDLTVFGDAQFDSLVNGIYINNGKYYVLHNNIILNSSIIQSSNPSSFTGENNTIVGREIMLNAESAEENSCFGFQAGYRIENGNRNTFIGSGAGQGIINGTFNTAIGFNSYAFNDYSYSTALGYGSQPTGDHQIVLGTAAETVFIDGSLNVFGDASFNSTLEVVGDAQFDSLVNGIYINNGKYDVLHNNIILNSSIIQSSNPSSFTGENNTIVGREIMLNAESAEENSCFGFQAGYRIENGNRNTFIGSGAGQGIINGTFNTAIGFNSYAFNDYSHSTALGYGSQPTGDHQIVLGTADEIVYCPGSLLISEGPGNSLSFSTPTANDPSGGSGYSNSTVTGTIYTIYKTESSINSITITTPIAYGLDFFDDNDGGTFEIIFVSATCSITKNGSFFLAPSVTSTNGTNLTKSFTDTGGIITFKQFFTNLNTTFNISDVGTYEVSFTVVTNYTENYDGITTYFNTDVETYTNTLGTVTFHNKTNITPWEPVNYFFESSLTTISNGSITTTDTVTAGTFVSGSDYRIKTDVKPLDTTFAIDCLNPVSYTNKLSGKKDTGFIAHEIQEIFPHLVTGIKDGEETQTLNYQGLIAILTREIQELKKRVQELENK